MSESYGLGTPVHPHFSPLPNTDKDYSVGFRGRSFSPPITPEGHWKSGSGAAVVHTLPRALEAHTPGSGSQKEQVRVSKVNPPALSPHPRCLHAGLLVGSADWYLLIKFHVPTCKRSGPNMNGCCLQSETPFSSGQRKFVVNTDLGSPLYGTTQQCGRERAPVSHRPCSWVLTWRDPQVGGNAESACPSGQQYSLITGLKNDCHTQIHASICERLCPGDLRLLVQSRKRAEKGSLARGVWTG